MDIIKTILDNIIQLFSYLALLFLALDGLISLIDKLGFLPKSTEKYYFTRDKRIIKHTLDEMNVYRFRPVIRQAIEYSRFELSAKNINAVIVLTDLIRINTRYYNKEVVLREFPQKLRLKYKIDLSEYTEDWENFNILIQLMLSKIIKSLSSLDTPIRIDKITAWSEKSPLAVITALQLRKPYYPYEPVNLLTIAPTHTKVDSAESVVIVDDIVLDGQKLVNLANMIRSNGIIVEHAFVLVERTDGKKIGGEIPSEILAKHGIKLHSIISIDDEQLSSLIIKK